MTFGQFVRSSRLERKLTQDGVAQAAGISKPYLSNIETGRAKNPPSPAVLTSLARALGIDPNALIERAQWERLPVDFQRELTALRGQRDQMRDLLEANPKAISAELRALLRASAKAKRGRGKKSAPPAARSNSLAHLTGCDDGEFITVTTDEMAPAYAPGDVVVVSPSRAATHGDDCLVRFADTDEALLRRYYVEGERIRLQPLNPAYPPRLCHRDEIKHTAGVVCRIERIGK